MSSELVKIAAERIAELEARMAGLEDENTVLQIENDAALRRIEKLEAERDQALWDREDGEEELEYTADLTKLRERLLGIISHDLASPLSAVLMAADHLRKERKTRTTESLWRSVRRLHALIEDLQVFSRMELGVGLPLALEQRDLGEFCSKIIEDFRLVVRDREFQVTSSGDLMTTFDVKRIDQAVTNLLVNAERYGSPCGKITVEVRGTGADTSVMVSNDGVIPSDLLPRVFKAFERGECSRTVAPEGLGLGLFIVKTVAEAHGGSVSVVSAHGRTTFRIRLPRSPGRDDLR